MMARTFEPGVLMPGSSRAIGWMVALSVWAAPLASAQQGAPENGEWPTYGGDLGSSKYSPLDQIDAANFGGLEGPGPGRRPTPS